MKQNEKCAVVTLSEDNESEVLNMKKNKNKQKAIKCPYCGAKTVIRDGTYVYGESSWIKKVCVCSRYPECDSFVGVYEHTGLPKGTLANSELRNKRIKAHKVFDSIWKKRIMDRDSAYRWMKDKFGLTLSQAHIGNFSDYMCNCLIDECNKVLTNNDCAQGVLL